MSATGMQTRRSQSGQALIVVLLIVMILTALAVSVTWSAKRNARDGAATLHDAQAYFALRGAVNYAAVELQVATNNGAAVPSLTPPPDTDSNGWTQIGDAWYRTELIDTASRVNINLATASQLALLPALSGDYATALAIVDWRDADDQEGSLNGASGAESSYYETLNPPYDAKNLPFDTVDELLLVRGMTPERLYQPTTANATDSTGANTAQTPVIVSDATPAALSEELTTYGRELNVAVDGTARVDVTSANASTLASGLGISSTLARRLVTYRRRTPITSIAGLMSVPGFSRTMMQQIADKVSIGSAQYRTGVYNINTAPAEVLATIPGVDQATYDTVTQARAEGTVFNTLGDLFALPSLNRGQLNRLVDHVCTKSSVYLVRVRVRVPGSQRIYAAEAMVEVLPSTSSTSTGASSAGMSSTVSEDTTPQATILQWRQVPKRYGWETWTPVTPQTQSPAQ